MSAATIRTDKADSSRTRILDAAARLFREEGYATVSLRAIAAAAGMKAGSVYYHFDSKQAIVTEILDTGITAVHEKLEHVIENLPADVSAGDAIRAGILTHLQALFEFNDYSSANVRIYAQVPSSARQSNRKLRRDYEALWARLLKRLLRKGEVRESVDHRAFILLLIGSLNATLEWFDPARGNLPELANNFAEIMLNGLLVERDSQR
jgi:AcrR family transcriptional regulator